MKPYRLISKHRPSTLKQLVKWNPHQSMDDLKKYIKTRDRERKERKQ